jgi:hypothetical protein
MVVDGTTYYYIVRAVDSGGNEDQNTRQASAMAKVAPPTNLQIRVNNAAQYTASASVSLSLSATGATQCRYSNDGASWSGWEGYTTQKTWTLTSGDGNKQIYYQCEDAVGNLAMPVSAEIHLDTVPPRLTLASPQNGGSYSSPFDLIATVSDPISTTVTCSGAIDSNAIVIRTVDVDKEQKLSLSASEGHHSLWINCSDGINSVVQSVSFTIISKPYVSLHIESGAGYVATRNVMLDVSATNAQDCRFSNDGTVSWSSWMPYKQTVQWTLSSGDGTKYVYAECRNSAGQISDYVSDDVILDSSPPPYISIHINNGAKTTTSKNVRLGLYCFSAQQCRYSNDESTWSAWEQYSTSKSWTLTGGEGKKYVYYTCKDMNGNSLGSASASISYSEIPPDPPSSLSIQINNGASQTSNPNVELELSARNAIDCRYKDDSTDWTGWYSYSSRKSWTLSSGDGRKTVYYQCRNDFGSSSQAYAVIYLDTSPPAPITDLSATLYHNGVYLRWSRPSGNVVSYNIYRSTHSLGMFAKINSVSSTSYQDYDVSAGEGYSYYVRPVDASGNEGLDSNIQNIDIPQSDQPLIGPSGETPTGLQ